MINGFKDSFLLNILRTLVIAGTIAMASALWTLDKQVAVNTQKLSDLLAHSDKNDADIQAHLLRIEQALEALKKFR